ncbi:PEP-CTERM sorting domain-containing protein [Rubritalea spongiae]|uniref:PEP-CTERM sorting domain-containing protein n=1 Tax=Rubritalea spongiae TaxID=430797 RepID=A0ABW5E5N1_9BACT
MSSSGLGTDFNESGAWSGGFDYSDLQTDLYTSAIIQANNQNTSRSLNIDSISVTAIPEPSSSSLLLLGGSALFLRRKRR